MKVRNPRLLRHRPRHKHRDHLRPRDQRHQAAHHTSQQLMGRLLLDQGRVMKMAAAQKPNPSIPAAVDAIVPKTAVINTATPIPPSPYTKVLPRDVPRETDEQLRPPKSANRIWIDRLNRPPHQSA